MCPACGGAHRRHAYAPRPAADAATLSLWDRVLGASPLGDGAFHIMPHSLFATRHSPQLNISVSPQIDKAWPEIVLPRGEAQNTI